ncbi:uncharacterized protein M421DRAFT_424454 [Didymella exigua CBS 183.55]|uniref:Uncharacterized protein n=1 Tax=Didymella exigua CBS 183.55 TaxID=1150837 RepID=A0A6A5RBC5_9PLEO|nr:uncharacterized protein M421DRAFT_424454 [Didymella exigua CBS 183.55]KAF1924823.1 hypothetical protein M421DRAFT_424454 [Didymella exigua CBS 183.55]
MSQVRNGWPGGHLPTSPWQSWPGAGLPKIFHPPGTVYVGHDRVPQYPGRTTCSMLGELDPHFPMTWEFLALVIVAFFLYIVWPLYVLRHLIRKSVYGGDDIFQTNHDAYKAKMNAMGKGRDEMSED